MTSRFYSRYQMSNHKTTLIYPRIWPAANTEIGGLQNDNKTVPSYVLCNDLRFKDKHDQLDAISDR